MCWSALQAGKVDKVDDALEGKDVQHLRVGPVGHVDSRKKQDGAYTGILDESDEGICKFLLARLVHYPLH